MRNNLTQPQRELLDAIREGDAERVSRIAAEAPDAVDATLDNGVSAVLLAVYHRRNDIAETLISAGAAVGLFEAAATGRLSDVERELDASPGAEQSYGADGHTPLGLACFFGHVPVVALLLERGANPNRESRNFQRVAPIHSAAASGSVEIVRMLLDAGANPRKEQETGFTALHTAAANGDVEIVELLLDRGASANARTLEGRTPATYASERGHHQVLQLLRNR